MLGFEVLLFSGDGLKRWRRVNEGLFGSDRVPDGGSGYIGVSHRGYIGVSHLGDIL